jgi:glycerol-3-phosphate acyltransferase PlsY
MLGRPLRIGLVGISCVLLCAVALARLALRPRVLELDDGRMTHLQRVQTGHQRAERVVFLDEGRRLAVTCPRYDRFVVYRVADGPRLESALDIRLEGKPVALCDWAGRMLVLERPSGDARHLVPGYWQVYSYEGARLGDPFEVGYDPDDLAIVADKGVALVLLSGHAEGETNRPAPSLLAIDLSGPGRPRIAYNLTLDQPGFDPTRIILSQCRTHAAILGFDGSVVGIDLSDPLRPSITGKSEIASRAYPTLSASENDTILLPAGTQADVIPVGGGVSRAAIELLATLDPDAGRLVLMKPRQAGALGSMSLPGPGNLGTIRATGLAYDPGRRLVAVADRSGGVHLLAFDQARRRQ